MLARRLDACATAQDSESDEAKSMHASSWELVVRPTVEQTLTKPEWWAAALGQASEAEGVRVAESENSRSETAVEQQDAEGVRDRIRNGDLLGEMVEIVGCLSAAIKRREPTRPTATGGDGVSATLSLEPAAMLAAKSL